MEMMAISPDKIKKKGSFIAGPRSSKSFLGGSFVMEEMAPPPETEEQRLEREKKETMENFKTLNKEESKHEMTKKGFDEFIVRAGRIVERALDCEVDIVGDFFADEEEEEAMYKKKKGDKISQQFIF